MFIFGHVGITLSAAIAVNAVVDKLQYAPKKQQSEDGTALAQIKSKTIKHSFPPASDWIPCPSF